MPETLRQAMGQCAYAKGSSLSSAALHSSSLLQPVWDSALLLTISNIMDTRTALRMDLRFCIGVRIEAPTKLFIYKIHLPVAYLKY